MGYGDKRRVFRVGERLTVEHNMTECPAVPIGGDSHAAAIFRKHYMVRIRFDLRIDSRQTRGLTTDHRLRDRAVDKLYTGITGLYFQIRRNGCKFQCLIGIFDRQPFLLKGKRSRRRQIAHIRIMAVTESHITELPPVGLNADHLRITHIIAYEDRFCRQSYTSINNRLRLVIGRTARQHC